MGKRQEENVNTCRQQTHGFGRYKSTLGIFFSIFFYCAVHRGPRVYLDYGKTNITESLGNCGAITAWSNNRALLDGIEKRS